MQACGIITEYNPFHYGHLLHLQQAKAISNCDVLINVMSGNFVQRGEPAIIDKWQRATEAIRQGCDVVIELPVQYVLQNADQFAQGAVQSLALAQVDTLVFGSECNDLHHLKTQAAISTPIQKDKSMAGASKMKSNDILGIAYLKALQQTTIRPFTIQRTNQYHDVSLLNNIASASAIRKGFYEGEDVSAFTSMAENMSDTFRLEAYYPYVQQLLLTMERTDIAQLFLIDEGIENLLCEKAALCTDMESFLQKCISKRYTRSRIQRTLMHLLMQTKKTMIQTLPPLDHIRVLAFNTIGQQYLKELKRKNVHIASRFNQLPSPQQRLYIKAINAYALPLSPQERIQFITKEFSAPNQVNL